MKLRPPSSLTTQLALVMAMAVLAAAAVQLAVLLLERNRTGLIEASGPAITRFADLSSDALNRNAEVLPDNQTNSFRRRGARILIADENLIQRRNMNRQGQLERRLERALADLGHDQIQVMAATRIIAETERRRRDIRPFGDRPGQSGRDRQVREIVLASQLAPERWISGAFLAPAPPSDEFGRLFLGALIAVGCVLGAAILMSARLIRPLTDLASAAGSLGKASPPQELELRGPREVRRTLSAFNKMSGRVSHLLREKDVMLGALGHDLRTPLASLRIRIESMEPEAEREKAIVTIEETTRMLESILDFARTGHAQTSWDSIDLPGLVESLADEYRQAGANVTAVSHPAEFKLVTNPDLLRRLLRNLIDNACQHADVVEIETRQDETEYTITVSDNGPGIPEDQFDLVLQPFYRGEVSRNRRHGGAGLGLALADTIARTLNGELSLSSRKPSGLQASVSIPRDQAGSA